MKNIILPRRRHLAILVLFLAIPLYAGMMQFDADPLCRTEKIPGLVSLAFGDLNGDGLPDMLANAFGTNQTGAAAEMLVFYNRAGKLPEAPDRKIPFPHCFRMAVHDFDQDGKNDIGLVAGCHLHFLFHKDGFDPEKRRGFFNTNQRVMDIQVCKLNDAGIFDVLVGPVWRKFTAGKSGFAVQNGYILGPRINDTWRTLAVDVNADGFMDIVGSGRDDNTLRIYYGPVLSLSVNPDDLSDFLQLQVSPGGIYGGFAVADLNGDHMADLAVADGRNRQTYIYYQNEPAGFDGDAQPSLTVKGGGVVYTPDLAGGGIASLVILDDSSKAGFFQPRAGRAIPDDLANFDQVLRLPRTVRLYFTDMDGNGRQDMIRQGHDASVAVHACRPGPAQPAGVPGD